MKVKVSESNGSTSFANRIWQGVVTHSIVQKYGFGRHMMGRTSVLISKRVGHLRFVFPENVEEME